MPNISQVTLPDNTTYDLADATLRSNMKVVAKVVWDTQTNTGTSSRTFSELYNLISLIYATTPVVDYTELPNPYGENPHYYLSLYSYSFDSMYGSFTFRSPTNTYGYEVRIAWSFGPGGGTDTVYRTQLKPSASWGNVSGTLSNQTDLNNALNAKQDTLTAGTNITIDANNVISATGGSGTETIFQITTDLWTGTEVVNGVTYNTCSISLTAVDDEHPEIGIVPVTGVLPTVAEQAAYNEVNYFTVDSTNNILKGYAVNLPTDDFAIVAKGVA